MIWFNDIKIFERTKSTLSLLLRWFESKLHDKTLNVGYQCETTTSSSVTTDLKLGKTEVWLFFFSFLFEKFPFNFKSQKCCKNYQKMTSTISSDKKTHTPSHTLAALQAKTTKTTLPHNLKFQQQPKNFKLAKTLKERLTRPQLLLLKHHHI